MLKQEFRLHIDDGSDAFVPQFIEKWVDYYEYMTGIEDVNELGRDLSPREQKLLTPEQVENMKELKKLINQN